MKLSEAIRLGSMMAPQGRFYYCDSDGNTCALGAALQALGFLRPNEYSGNGVADVVRDKYVSSAFYRQHGDALRGKGAGICPECREDNGEASSTIIHLNNDHEWTRERIADWVETIENAQEQPDPALTPAIQRGGE